jgi:hypothetical protein
MQNAIGMGVMEASAEIAKEGLGGQAMYSRVRIPAGSH